MIDTLSLFFGWLLLVMFHYPLVGAIAIALVGVAVLAAIDAVGALI